MKLHFVFVLFILLSCDNANKPTQDSEIQESVMDTLNSESEVVTIVEEKIDTLEQCIINAGLIDVQSLNSNIMVELKYSTEDNFMHQNL